MDTATGIDTLIGVLAGFSGALVGSVLGYAAFEVWLTARDVWRRRMQRR